MLKTPPDLANRIINPNLVYLRQCYFDLKAGVVLEGSSRSGKTWSCVDFIVWLCSVVEKGATINIIRGTYSSFKTTLYEDFKRRLPMYGIASPFDDERMEVKTFFLFGNKITFLGADSEEVVHGVGSDYTYFNEFLDIPEKVYNQLKQRCRKFWFADYNPKASVHWVYKKVCQRPDVGFLRTTFLDNPFVSDAERREILSYEPTHPHDRELPKDERREHPTNIEYGTADDYMWEVYGLGLRTAPEGLIFKSVTWIDEMPDNLELHFYGLDFGYSIDPSALSHGAVGGYGKSGKRKLYLECPQDEDGNHFYKPTETFADLKPMLDWGLGKKNKCWADPSGEHGERGMISAAQNHGYKVYSTMTGPGTIMYGISILKGFELNIVRSEVTELEHGNYKFKEINGIRVEEPVDEYNHWWDASRMMALSELERYAKIVTK